MRILPSVGNRRGDDSLRWRFGRRSLLLGFAVLSVMLLLVEAINQTLPGGPLASSLQEGLTILGWVALWRPAEIVLYEWRPVRREPEIA